MINTKEKYGWMSNEQANMMKKEQHINKQYGGPYKFI